MHLKELILQNRSYRRFHQEVPVTLETLRQLVDLARLSASAANKQPLKYILVRDASNNALVFACLGWAGYTIRLVIALGKAKEEVLIEPMAPNGDIRYWRSKDGRHHVPKRSLDEIIIRQGG